MHRVPLSRIRGLKERREGVFLTSPDSGVTVARPPRIHTGFHAPTQSNHWNTGEQAGQDNRGSTEYNRPYGFDLLFRLIGGGVMGDERIRLTQLSSAAG